MARVKATRIVAKRFGVGFWVPIAMALISGWWFVALVRNWNERWEGNNFAPTLFEALLFLFILLAAGFWLLVARDNAKVLVLDSACPCCGARAQRSFGDPAVGPSPAACGSCLAYLRVRGKTRVSEERTDTVDDRTSWPYAIGPELYTPVAKTDADGQFVFEMPAICALCGVLDARQRRTIANESIHGTDGGFGLLGEIASIAASEAVTTALGTSYQNRRAGTSSSLPAPEPTAEDDNNRRLSKLEVPVCAAHPKALSPISYDGGRLQFASYRYYKAFLAANRIAPPKPDPAA